MAITDTGYVSPRVSYTAAPGQTTFAIPFQFFEQEELIVNVNDVRVTSGFTTTGSGDPEGGSLVFDEGLAGGDVVEILRDIVPMRISQFPLSGPFDIAMLNLELDRIILMTQELVTLDTLVRDEFDVLIAEIDTFREDTAEALAAVPLVLDARDATLLARDAAQLSESNAAGSAGAASTSATNANQAKIDAETARDSASGHRLNAQNAQTAAETARDLAQAAFADFEKRSLGAFATDPATDNAGNPLEVGTVYWNTGANEFRVWDGAAWRSAVFVAGSLDDLSDVDLTTALPTAGDGLSYDGENWVPGPAGGGMFKGNNGTVGSRSGDLFRINAKTLTEDTTIAGTENASVTGPLTIADGVTLTVAPGGTLRIL